MNLALWKVDREGLPSYITTSVCHPISRWGFTSRRLGIVNRKRDSVYTPLLTQPAPISSPPPTPSHRILLSADPNNSYHIRAAISLDNRSQYKLLYLKIQEKSLVSYVMQSNLSDCTVRVNPMPGSTCLRFSMSTCALPTYLSLPKLSNAHEHALTHK